LTRALTRRRTAKSSHPRSPIVEVAFALHEKTKGVLDSAIENKIDALWTDRYAVKLIEFHEGIARDARTRIRGAVASGMSGLKPADAIHLASARTLKVAEFHTYSGDLPRFASLTGLSIVEPFAQELPLF
jgi:predicted nucleic acid-binding protein